MKEVQFILKSDNTTISFSGMREMLDIPIGSKDLSEPHWLLLYPCGYRQFIPKSTYEKAIVCHCGHDLGAHPPDPAHLFAWPCKLCSCTEYNEKV